MLLIIISFFAGILTVLAPCVLPILPVIFSGSASWASNSKAWRIIISCLVSILVFTLLFRLSVEFINIDPKIWVYFSSGIIVFYGLTLLFPSYRDKISLFLFANKPSTLTKNAWKHTWVWWDILLGISLGPLFSTCSPTYALLFSVVLPSSFLFGLICMIAYVLGFGIILYVFVIGWKKIIRKFAPLANSHGVFKKTLGIILILVGVLIFTGKISNIESSFAKYLPDFNRMEHFFIKELNLGITK